MAKFVVTSFEDSRNKVTKSDKHYTAQCPDGTCTLVVDGNPTEPIVCSSGAKTTTAVVTGIGIFLAVVGVFAVLAQSEAVPIVGRVLKIFFSIFGDKNLPMRLKFFACCYNFTFMLYSIYSIFISQQTISDTSENMCTIFAIVGYVLYISAIFLSVIMMMITLDALGCWKPTLKNTFYIFTGNKRNFIPFIHSYGIPLIITGIFAITLKSFFKRNDGYCWIRPDYAILALWFPLILLFLTIPLYIILFARRWSDFGFSKIICAPLIVQEDFDAYEEEKKKREEQDKQEKLKEFTEKLFGKSANEGNDNDEGEEDKRDVETIILTNETLARLLIPQIFLAVPLIAENLALYYSELTGWHYLFILTQALQLIVLNAMDWLSELPEKLEFVRAAFDAIKGKPKEEKSDDTKWGTNSQSRETTQF
uniref:G-protein coupled receptors family 2 profile 2 domain-containing protein n=1 Tax=Panagrolaimus davidi TaxID=227884 RepID=A0A914PUC0_9BILA